MVVPFSMRLALLTIALVGCGELSRIEPDLCGNGVIEPGEDCEQADELDGACGAPGTEEACRFVCAAGAAASCPTGWACGVDGICRRGDGRFGLTIELEVAGDRSELADFTADGFVDLTAVSRDIARFRFGPTMNFETTEALNATRGLGVVDVNGDGASDGFVAGPNSWSILLGAEREIESSLHPSGNFGAGDHRLGIYPLPDAGRQALGRPFGLVQGPVCGAAETTCLLLYASNQIEAVAVAFQDRAGPPVAASLGLRSAEQADVRSAIAELGATSLSLIGIECAQPDCSTESFVFGASSAVALASGGLNATAPVSFSNPSVAAGGTLFTDADGDGDSDLLVWARDDQGRPGLGILYNQEVSGEEYTRKLVGECAASVCTGEGGDHCQSELTIVRWASSFRSVGGGSPGVLLAAAQLDGGGPIDIVTSTGIFLGQGSDESCGFADDFEFVSFGWAPADAPWSEAAVGDFNGDGVTDVAAIAPGLRQVEVYLGNVDGALTRAVIHTAQPPLALAAGDLDADGADDVTFAARGDASESSEIWVRWGSSSGALVAPELLGQSLRVGPGSLAMRPSLTDLGEFDADAELFIGAGAGDEDLTVAVVAGSANRALASPILPRVARLETAYDLDGASSTPGELPGGEFSGRAWCVGAIAAGQFFSEQGSADIVTLGELVAVADVEIGGPSALQLCESARGRRYPIVEGRRGAGNGNVAGSPPWCDALSHDEGREPCTYRAEMRAIDLDDDALDELAIVAPLADRNSGVTCSIADEKRDNRIFVGDPQSGESPSTSVCSPGFELEAAYTVTGLLRKVEVFDVDGSGTSELLVSTDEGVSVLFANGGQLVEPAEVAGLPATGCAILDAAVVRSGCEMSVELAVLQECDGEATLGSYVVDWSEGLEAELRSAIDLDGLMVVADGPAELRVGDVNGDGLDDVYARLGSVARVFSAVVAPPLGTEDVCVSP